MNIRRYFAGWAVVASLSLMAFLPARAETAAAGANSIQALVVAQQAGTTVVKIDMSEALPSPPPYFSIASPARVVFDFPGATNGLGRTLQQVNEGELNSINIVQVGERTRLVLNVKRAGSVETRLDGKSFYVTLAPTTVSTVSAPPAQRFAETVTSATAPHAIRDINFRRGKNGEGLITVDLSDPNTGIDIRLEGVNLVAEFQKVTLPEQLRRKLDVTDFATPVTSVNTVTQGDNVRLMIVPHGLWEHTAYQADNQFVIEVKALKEDPSKVFQGSQRQGYQGEKVSLNFQNIPLRELLHVFADITNFNIVVSDTVTGNVSLRLNDVPWDQALEIVLQQKGLDMRKSGNVIWIAPRDELAAKEKLQLESLQQISELEPMRTETFQLNYQKAVDVQKLLTNKDQTILSKRGSTIADIRTNKIFVTDAPSRLESVRRFLGEIDVAMRQVLIEARIVEAQDSFSKALGVRLGGTDQYGMDFGHTVLGQNGLRYGISGSAQQANTLLPQTNYLTYMNQGGSGCLSGYLTGTGTSTQCVRQTNIPGGSAVGDLSPLQFVNLPVANAAGSFALSLFNGDKSQLLTMEITANEADGVLKTISSPRILTADQAEAQIKQGTKVPYLQATSSGATSTTYLDAVLLLKVKPQITADGKIKMTLNIDKDELGTLTSAGYTVLTKHIETEVVVDNGGTVVIGGIYEQTISKSVQKVPLLGDLPYLGFLFKNTSNSDAKTELMVFITPKIVSQNVAVR
jgi:type IV pilus assembly protein PilQ